MTFFGRVGKTYATFILALSTRFLGLTMLYFASSLGGGLIASDHSLPVPPGKPGVNEPLLYRE